MNTRTELCVYYEPHDFFEQPLDVPMERGVLHIDNGTAFYRLSAPLEHVPEALRQEITEEVNHVFSVRQMLTSKRHKVTEISVRTYHGSGENQSTSTEVHFFGELSFTPQVEAMEIDASGKVIHDSRGERLKATNDLLAALVPKMAHPTLRTMVESLGRASRDRDSELSHLYDVREAAVQYFGNEGTARAKLGITKQQWSELGQLANDEPLRQGRHRGRHATQLRDATQEELDRARKIAWRIVEAFAAIAKPS
jgi:hypothetical protein